MGNGPALSRYYFRFFCALVLLIAAGCGGSSSTPDNPPPSLGKLYVTNGLTRTVLRFPAGANGNVSPQLSITMPVQPFRLALDVPHDRLAVGASSVSSASIVIMDNASTTLSPVRTISGPTTTLNGVGYISIDSAKDLLYVVTEDSASHEHILVFGPATTISGNVAPLHSIDLPTNVSLRIPAIALDSANNRLFVVDENANAINVFDNASTLNGTVAPDRVISGPATQLDQPVLMALDDAGRLIVGGFPFPRTIHVFANAGSANGNVAPIASTNIFVLAIQLAVSPTGDLYVVDGQSRISVFSNVTAPTLVRVITGPNTLLDPPPSPQLIPAEVLGVALDPTRN